MIEVHKHTSEQKLGPCALAVLTHVEEPKCLLLAREQHSDLLLKLD